MDICCPSSVQGFALRLTQEDVCGIPVSSNTAMSRIQTTGFIELTLSPDIEDGLDITTKKANGEICIRRKDQDRLKGFDIELALCGVPVPVMEMLLGASLLFNAAGDVKGLVFPESKQQALPDPIGVEIWSLNNSADCGNAASAGDAYIDWVLPRTSNWQVTGSLNFNNGELEIRLSGYAENNNGWFPSFPDTSATGDFDFQSAGLDPYGSYPLPTTPLGVTEDEWTAADVLAIRAGGPLVESCVGALPAPLDDCGYVTSATVGPIAVNDTGVDGLAAGFTTLDVLLNDTPGSLPLDPGSIVVSNIVGPTGITIVNNGDGTFDVSAAATGAYSFDYTVADTDGNVSNVATVDGTLS